MATLLGVHKTNIFIDNVSLKDFETQPRSIAKQLHWHDILALMDIELIHKLGKDNVVLNALSCKDNYQGEMHWENTQIFRAIFVKENNLERKI
jgi:hypothetical protein